MDSLCTQEYSKQSNPDRNRNKRPSGMSGPSPKAASGSLLFQGKAWKG